MQIGGGELGKAKEAELTKGREEREKNTRGVVTNSSSQNGDVHFGQRTQQFVTL